MIIEGLLIVIHHETQDSAAVNGWYAHLHSIPTYLFKIVWSNIIDISFEKNATNRKDISYRRYK